MSDYNVPCIYGHRTSVAILLFYDLMHPRKEAPMKLIAKIPIYDISEISFASHAGEATAGAKQRVGERGELSSTANLPNEVS